VLELRAMRLGGGRAITFGASDDRATWVHYGSSISHCLEAPRPTDTWPAISARRAGVGLVNLSLAGQCMCDPHVARIIRDLPADLISAKVGINLINQDSMRERTFVPALHGFLDTIRDWHSTVPIALVTPIYCPLVEDHPGPTPLGADGRNRVVDRDALLGVGSLTLERVRELTAEVVEMRRADGDEDLHLLDGLALFGEGDAEHLPDQLHPDPLGYQMMGVRFAALAFADGAPLAR
jgi:hypothetical protein